MTDVLISDRQAKARRMEEAIRGYFDACNTGNVDAVAAFFAPGAVHYFPPDMYDGAVIEWTHEKTKTAVVLRGDEWYRFEASTGLITEIRAYYASPQAAGVDRLELGGFPYAEGGYAASD